MLEIVEQARAEAPSVEHVVGAPWDELVADCPGELPPADLDSETPYLLTYTSGTTGPPKGVILTAENLLIDADGISAWHDFGADDRLMCVLPIHHVNGTIHRHDNSPATS
mgnify:CR=1 FL=1